MNNFFVKSLGSILCLTILLSSFPYQVFAETKPSVIETSSFAKPNIENLSAKANKEQNIRILTSGGTQLGAPNVDQQVKDVTKGGLLPSSPRQKQTTPEASPFADALGCSVGAVLANAITTAIYSGLNVIMQVFGIKLVVPEDNVPQTVRENGLQFLGVPILPGWNSIAYCLANALIVFVADSTIAWIQSGFEGKPAFVDDPTKLFKDLADYEMSNFLENFADGMLCEPFSAEVKLALVDDYTGASMSTRGRCTVDDAKDNISSFLRGDSFSFETLSKVGSNSFNTPAGAYLNVRNAALNNIAEKRQPIETQINWGRGYFNWISKDGPTAGKTITPGSVVQSQLEKVLGLAPDRLVLAEKFDQVIAALVNYLIKAALSETLNAFKN